MKTTDVSNEVMGHVRRLLKGVLLDDVEIIIRPGAQPRMMQVVRRGTVVFTVTAHGREAALPAPKQKELFEDAPARPRSPTPNAPPGATSVAALGIREVRAKGTLDEVRVQMPALRGVIWHRLGGGECGTLVGAEIAEQLVEHGATSELFDPSTDPPVVVEVWDTSPEGLELAAQLAAELGGERSTIKTQQGGLVSVSWVSLPAISDAGRLAWVLSYLLEGATPFWVRPARRGGKAVRS